MNYTNYNEWVKYIEETHNSHQANLNTKNTTSGLKIWFDSIVKENDTIKKELNRLSSIRSEKTTVPIELDLIMTAVAKAFYPQYYDKDNNIVIKKDSNKAPTIFAAEKKYGQNLTYYWQGKIIPVSIPKVDGKLPHYWIEICSALQKEYHIFESLNDINNFIFTINNNQHSDEISHSELFNFGLYVRSIQHICVAYAILHGYSVMQCRALLGKCIKIEQNVIGYPEETRTVGLKRELEEYIISKSEDTLINWIENNSQRFLNDSRLKHKTAVNEVLQRLGGSDELKSTHDFKKRIERVVELFLKATQMSEKKRSSELKRYLLDQIDITSMLAMADKFELMRDQISLTNGSQEEQYITQEGREAIRRDISSKNKSKTTKDETVENHVRQAEAERRNEAEEKALELQEQGETIAAEFINTSLRNMLIVYEMSQMPARFDNALFPIDDQLNGMLLKCGLRDIAFSESENQSDVSVINITHNMFDWVVVESLIFEEQAYMKKIRLGVETQNDGVSGKTFIKYLKDHQ